MTTPLIRFWPLGTRELLQTSLAITVRRIGQARHLKQHYVRSLLPLLLSLGLDLYVDDLEQAPALLGPAATLNARRMSRALLGGASVMLTVPTTHP